MKIRAAALLVLVFASVCRAEGQAPADPWEGLWRGKAWRVQKTAPEADDVAPVSSWTVEGALGMRYVFRGTDDGRHPRDDQDVYTSLTLHADDSADWSVEFDGTVASDIDGDRDGPFANLASIHQSSRGFLYRAYVERRGLGPIGALRAGRQVHSQGTELYRFDGVMARTEAFGGLTLDVFGGSPVQFYENHRSSDWLAGGDLTYKLTPDAEVRIGYAHITDARQRSGQGRKQRDNRYDATFVYRLASWGSLRADAATIDGRATETRLLLRASAAEIGLSGRLSFLGRFGSWQRFTGPFSYFDEVLVRYEDYYQFDFSLAQSLGEHLAFDGGVMIRELKKNKAEGPFNHEFVRLQAGLTTLEWPLEGLSLSLFGVAWLAQQDKEYTWGARIEYRASPSLRIAVGSDWALYSVDRWRANERERVRTAWVHLSWQPSERFEFGVETTQEWSEAETYFTLEAQVELFF